MKIRTLGNGLRPADLALAARGVLPVLLVHEAGLAHKVVLDDFILNGVEADLGDINLATGSNRLHDNA